MRTSGALGLSVLNKVVKGGPHWETDIWAKTYLKESKELTMQIRRKRAFQEGAASARALRQEHGRSCSRNSREARMATPEQQEDSTVRWGQVEGLTVYGFGFTLGKMGSYWGILSRITWSDCLRQLSMCYFLCSEFIHQYLALKMDWFLSISSLYWAQYYTLSQ